MPCSRPQEIAAEEKALGELQRKSEGLVKRAEALQAQIDGAGGEKLRKQRGLCEKLQEVGWGRLSRGQDGKRGVNGLRAMFCCRARVPWKFRATRLAGSCLEATALAPPHASLGLFLILLV